jgi:NADH dehydrogenase
VARIVWPFKAQWSGFMAWMTWLFVHIFFLIGLRNRFSVFRSWAYTYIQREEGVRLIVGSQELPGWNTLAPSATPSTAESDAKVPVTVA